MKVFSVSFGIISLVVLSIAKAQIQGPQTEWSFDLDAGSTLYARTIGVDQFETYTACPIRLADDPNTLINPSDETRGKELRLGPYSMDRTIEVRCYSKNRRIRNPPAVWNAFKIQPRGKYGCIYHILVDDPAFHGKDDNDYNDIIVKISFCD